MSDILNIQSFKRGNMDVYNQLLIKKFGKKLAWEDVKALPKKELFDLRWDLEKEIIYKKSPLDVDKLSRAIQSSRSGIGGSAMTKFKCLFCNTEEVWGNTATPDICRQCARDMAKKIILSEMDLFK